MTCSNDPTGYIPLDYPTGTYQGESGGLYGGGTNRRPARHTAIGQLVTANVYPLDTNGDRDDDNGVYLMVGLGPSHANIESNALTTRIAADTYPNVRTNWNFYSAAVAGDPDGGIVQRMVDPNHNFWAQSEQKVIDRSRTAAQVQFAWLKTTYANPANYHSESGRTFPDTSTELADNLLIIARNAKATYPNLKVLLISSRSYAGYSDGTLSPEPWAYEDGFAVKWAIHKQISGQKFWVPAEGIYASAGPDANMPWLDWGPYIWADGTNRKNRIQEMTWTCPGDFQADFTHPSSDGGGPKVADALDQYMSAHPVMARFYKTT